MAVVGAPGFGPASVSHAIFWPPETAQTKVPEGRTPFATPETVAVKVARFPSVGAAGRTVTAIDGVALATVTVTGPTGVAT